MSWKLKCWQSTTAHPNLRPTCWSSWDQREAFSGHQQSLETDTLGFSCKKSDPRKGGIDMTKWSSPSQKIHELGTLPFWQRFRKSELSLDGPSEASLTSKPVTIPEDPCIWNIYLHLPLNVISNNPNFNVGKYSIHGSSGFCGWFFWGYVNTWWGSPVISWFITP